MSRYYDASLSFLRNLPVFIADLAETASPFAQFLADKGAIVQSAADADTRYVITMRPVAELPEHHAEAVSRALSVSQDNYLHADDVRARLLRRSRLDLDDAATGHLRALPETAFIGI